VPLSAADVKAHARECGFDLCGIAPPEPDGRLRHLADWIARGYAGDMQYLADSLDERVDPRRVLPTVRSVIALGCIYNTSQPYSSSVVESDRAVVARYAWGDDYHETLRNRLRPFVRWLASAGGPGVEAFSCVDSGPVQERVFAERAGLGWIGKHTCLIDAKLGSWMFLAAVLTNIDLDVDSPVPDQCGTCTRCIDACPTGAIVEPYTLDATRCLSYLTIESRGSVDPALRESIGRQILGCDICQDVCPWNRRAASTDDPVFQPRDGLAYPRLIDLCQLSDDGWRALLRHSAMRRAGLRRIRRSLAYASVHLESDDSAAALEALTAHPSGADPDVAEAIGWARLRQGYGGQARP